MSLAYTKNKTGSLRPVLAPDLLSPLEFAQIAGDDHQTIATRMPGNHQIVEFDHTAAPLEVRPDIGGVCGRIAVERQLGQQSGGEVLRLPPDAGWIAGMFSSIEQLIEHHIRLA